MCYGAARLNKVGHLYFGKKERYLYTFCTYTLILAIIVFGPSCGVIAAGLEYGAYTHYAASYGERLRTAASFVSSIGGVTHLLHVCLANSAPYGAPYGAPCM